MTPSDYVQVNYFRIRGAIKTLVKRRIGRCTADHLGDAMLSFWMRVYRMQSLSLDGPDAGPTWFAIHRAVDDAIGLRVGRRDRNYVDAMDPKWLRDRV